MEKFAQWLNGFTAILSAVMLVGALLGLVFGDETLNYGFIKTIIYWAAPIMAWTAMNWMTMSKKRIRFSIEPHDPQGVSPTTDEAEVAPAA